MRLRIWLAVLLWTVVVVALRAEGGELSCSFRDGVKLTPGFRAAPESALVVVDSDLMPGGGALELQRGRGEVSLTIEKLVETTEDFSIEFDLVRMEKNSSFAMALYSPTGANWGSIFIDSGGIVRVLNRENQYIKSDIILKDQKQYRVCAAYFRESGEMVVRIGDKLVSAAFPADRPLRRIVFSPQPPEGNRVLLGEVVFRSSPSAVVSRENALRGAEMTISDHAGTRTEARLSDGKLDTAGHVGVGGELTFRPAERINATAIQIYSGTPFTSGFPSGSCALKSYVIEGFSNGSWVELVRNTNAPDFDRRGGVAEDEFFLRHDLAKPVAIEEIRLKVVDSHDTGRRTTGDIAPEERVAAIREFQLFSDRPAVKTVSFGDLLQMDYRLPVYRHGDRAELTLVAAEDPRTPKTGKLTLFAPDGGKCLEKTVEIVPGRSTVAIDISDFPNGRFKSVLETESGSLTRLLRIDRLPVEKIPPEPREITGRKLLFTPDEYLLVSRENLPVEVIGAKAYELAHTPSPEKLLLTARSFTPHTDGSYTLMVDDYDYRGFFGGKRDLRTLVSKSRRGPFVAGEPSTAEARAPERCIRPFLPGNTFVPAPPAGTRYEWYDPERDGKIPLNAIHRVFAYPENDYGCVKAPARTHWAVGRTADGRWVMLTREPILTDTWRFDGDDFDDGRQSNDNFAGSWLSVDPEHPELFLAHGQTVRRDAPYAVPYDNLDTAFRLLALYSTTDGVEWRFRNYLTLPDENDSPGAQHYGGLLLPLPDAELMLFYLYAYDADAQQIYIELNYSRDGIHFYRFPGAKPFLRSGTPGEWYYGHAFVRAPLYRDGDSYWQFINYASSAPHYYPEVFPLRDRLDEITGTDFRKRFAGRELAERLPVFESIGGWEGLAADAHQVKYSAGVLEFRVDGWFALSAGEETGRFTTRRLHGTGRATANAEVAPGGFIEIDLCDGSGEVLESRRLTGDGVELPLFDQLPEEEFYLSGRMRNARLYAIDFR